MIRRKYGYLRLKRETLDDLKRMKQAFEMSYNRPFSNDDFIKQMAAAVEDGDCGVWEIYCKNNEVLDTLMERVHQE